MEHFDSHCLSDKADGYNPPRLLAVRSGTGLTVYQRAAVLLIGRQCILVLHCFCDSSVFPSVTYKVGGSNRQKIIWVAFGAVWDAWDYIYITQTHTHTNTHT